MFSLPAESDRKLLLQDSFGGIFGHAENPSCCFDLGNSWQVDGLVGYFDAR